MFVCFLISELKARGLSCIEIDAMYKNDAVLDQVLGPFPKLLWFVALLVA